MNSLFKVPLFPDEQLRSHLSRLAHANGRTARLFCSDLGIDADKLLRGDLDNIDKFANLVSLPPAEVFRAALSEEGKEVATAGVRVGKRRLSGHVRFCPSCWQEDEARDDRLPGTRRYLRSVWLLQQYRTCALHGRRIADLGALPRQRNVDFCQLVNLRDSDIRTQTTTSHPEVPSALDCFLHDRTAGQTRYGPLLDGMELAFALELSVRFGVALRHGKHVGQKYISEDELVLASAASIAALREDRDGPGMALDRIIDAPALPSIRNGAALYGQLNPWLCRMKHHPGFGSFAAVLREHAIANVDLPSGSEVFGPVETTPWVTIPRIAKEVGLSPVTIVDRFREAGMITGPVNDALIPRATFDKFRRSIADRVTISDAARDILGCRLDRSIDPGLRKEQVSLSLISFLYGLSFVGKIGVSDEALSGAAARPCVTTALSGRRDLELRPTRTFAS